MKKCAKNEFPPLLTLVQRYVSTKWEVFFTVFVFPENTIRYDTIEEINVDSKAEYTA